MLIKDLDLAVALRNHLNRINESIKSLETKNGYWFGGSVTWTEEIKVSKDKKEPRVFSVNLARGVTNVQEETWDKVRQLMIEDLKEQRDQVIKELKELGVEDVSSCP